MFSWKLILALLVSAGSATTDVPVEYLPEGSPPITVQAVNGDPTGDYAQAGRVMGDSYSDTLACRITVNNNSQGWRVTRGPKTGNTSAAMVKYLRDDTVQNDSPRLFLLAHELGHCFDNEVLPTAASAVDADAYRVWKEGFADAFAAMAMKKQGTPVVQLKNVAIFRGSQLSGEYGDKWEAMISQAADTDVIGKSDKDLLAMAKEIRRNTWKSSTRVVSK